MADDPSSSVAQGSRDDVEFLKEQVQRLSAVLSQYQKRYLPPGPEEEAAAPLPADGPHASWLTDKRLLAPLLTEYDSVIRELNQQITSYQSELESLSSRVQQTTEENTRLHSELRRNLETQLQVASGEGGEASVAVEGLQHQLDIISKERDSYLELWKQTSHELEHVQKTEQEKAGELLRCKKELATTQQSAMLAQQAMEKLQSTCQQLDQERQQCLRTAQSQEQDLSSLQEALGQARAELKTAGSKNTELKRALDEITLQLRRREAVRQQSEGHEHSLDDRIHHLHLANTDLEGRLLAAQREVALLREERAGLERRTQALQNKTASLEQREYETLVHMRESVQLVESALLEREGAQVREQQQAQEVARLRRAMTALLGEAGERTRREVAAVREECNKNIDRMAEEIQKLEEECGERRAQLERAFREKKAMERELERATSQGPLEQARTGEALHELQSRVCVAERARDEALRRLEGETAARKRLETCLVEEKRASEELGEEQRRWQREVQEEGQQLREHRIRLTSQCDELQQKLRTSEQAREAAERRLNKELSVVAQRHELREKELQSRLEGAGEAHQRAALELREMLAAQHRIGARWREESKSLTQKFESTVTTLQSEVLRHKKRNDDLTLQLNNFKLSKEQLSKQLGSLSSSHTALQHQLRETESRVEVAGGQVAVLLSREKQLLQERRDLQRQVDSLRLQMARTAGAHLAGSGLHSSLLARPATVARPSSHPLPTTLPPSSPKWTEALSELRHSIHQVRQDLGLSHPGREHHSRSRSRGSHQREPTPEGEEGGSEHSTFSRGDLSPPSHASSHSTAIPS